MNTFRARYYDGTTLKPKAVTLIFEKKRLCVLEAGNQTEIKLEGTYSCDIHQHHLSLTFAEGRRYDIFEPSNDLIQMLEPEHLDKIFHRFKKKPFYLIALFVLSLLGVTLVTQWTIPTLARLLIAMTPEGRLDTYSEVISNGVIDQVGKPSRLCPSSQKKIINLVQDKLLSSEPDIRRRITINFRSDVGINAFALPDGNILLTDDLVRFISSHEELLGIVGHEIGHVMERHSLQRILETVILGFLWDALTGDLSSTAAAAAALPLIMQYSAYSRKAEHAADAYGVQLMKKNQLDPTYMAYFFAKLDTNTSDTANALETSTSNNTSTSECFNIAFEALATSATSKETMDKVLTHYLSKSNISEESKSISDLMTSHPLSKERVNNIINQK